ncbi:MAG TPA: hypothetical protein VEC56_12805 [Candidatus Krumholzibacteria bacterium]|nr:hypothetical protein [Candidatus Krumholzibacteria bacterium]
MMHHSRWTAFACAIATAVLSIRADAAGVYENAATESALLVSPQRTVVRGTLEIGAGGGVDATLFRVLGAFPARSWFLFAVEMPFVSVSAPDGIESGPGDLFLRARARVWGSNGRALSLLGTVGTGTGNRRFFPYSSQTLDVNASVGFVDSVGAMQPFVVVGYEWMNRFDEWRYTPDTSPANHLRATAGTDLDLGENSDLRGGVMFHWYDGGAERTLVFAGLGYQWTPTFRLLAEGQVEAGPQAQRVGNWSLTAGLSVLF